MNPIILIGLAIMGFLVTLVYDVLRLISYPLSGGLGVSGIMAALVKGMGFTLLHELSNAFVFVMVVPNIVKYLK